MDNELQHTIEAHYMFNPQPITLSTDRIELQPLGLNHAEAFHLATNDDAIWTWMVPNPCKTIEATQKWIAAALAERDAGRQVPFITIDRASGKLIGSTRYLNIMRADKGIEIGHTWITPEFQQSYVNSHAKYSMLQHAFETLGAIRVEFKTHESNQKSRNAILRLGAQFEGIMRQQRILPNGNLRNTALFSIIDGEWPQVKQQLLSQLERI
jgi:RimJ/RimL family protein N-acetyltransferase